MQQMELLELVKNKAERRKRKPIEEKKNVCMNNQEYFDEYFKIFTKIFERYELYESLSKVKSEKITAERKINSFNQSIKTDLEALQKNTELSKKNNIDLFIEEAAKKYNLNEKEKNILLFSICYEVRNSKHIEKTAMEIINMTDPFCPVSEKMQQILYFSDESPLIKYGMLSVDARRIRNAASGYSVNNSFMKVVAKALSGELVKWEGYNEERETDEEHKELQEVGYVRDANYMLSNVILKEEVKEKMRFFLESNGNEAFNKYNISKKIKNGKGLIFLFYGPPGTGKSMLAEAVASHFGKKILELEVPKILNRWVGDTEKSIYRFFETAKKNDFIIVINEADTLLYNRGYATQEHDIKFVNVMLNELEKYEGVAILTTNMDMLLDPALERRISFKLKFDLPTQKERENIWRELIPLDMVLSNDIDFQYMAEKYKFAGGNIKNAILNAIRRMGQNKEECMTMDMLVFGADIEKEGMFTNNNKQGRVIEGFSGG